MTTVLRSAVTKVTCRFPLCGRRLLLRRARRLHCDRRHDFRGGRFCRAGRAGVRVVRVGPLAAVRALAAARAFGGAVGAAFFFAVLTRALLLPRAALMTELCSFLAAASISSFARFTAFFASLNCRRACLAACLAPLADFFAACQRSRASSTAPCNLLGTCGPRASLVSSRCSLRFKARRSRIAVHNRRRQNNTASVMPPLARISSITSGKEFAPGKCATFMPNTPVISVIGSSTAVSSEST